MRRELSNPDQDRTWREIIDTIAEQLGDAEIPEQVIEATELLLSGYPVREAAAMLGLPPAKIRSWIKEYPQMAVVLADSRASLIRWRMNQLDQQFLKAARKSREILDLPLDDTSADPKILAAVGQHVRYIMGLMAGQRIDIHVTHGLDDPLLRAKQDALQYLVEGLRAGQEAEQAVIATYRVIDDKTSSGPLLDSNGNPYHGQFGQFTQNETGYQCHICGKYYKWLQKHVITAHQIDTQTYELTFLFEPGSFAQIRPDRETHEE